MALTPRRPFTDVATELNAAMSTNLNGVLVPAQRLPELVHRFAHPLLVNNANADHPLSFCGSSVLIKHRNRCFQICCKHQFENLGRSPEETKIVESQARRILLPPIERFRPTYEPPDDTRSDLQVLEYPRNNALSNRFLTLSAEDFVDIEIEGAQRVYAHILIGFPREAIGYEVSKDTASLRHLIGRYVSLHCGPDEIGEFCLEHRRHIRTLDSFTLMEIEPDGISGGPLFSIYQDATDQIRLGFCGIVTDANPAGLCAIYPSSLIRAFIEQI